MEEEEAWNSKPHVAILCSPGMGHLIPVLELGSRLATHHNLHVTVLVVPSPSSPRAQSLLLQSASATSTGLHIIQLPPVDISNLLHENSKPVTRIRVTVRETIPAIKSALSSLTNPVAALVVDIFATELVGVACELGIPKRYVFVPSNAWYLALIVSMPILDKQVEGEFVDIKEPLTILGCKAVRPEDLIDSMMDRSDRQYHEAVMRGVEITMADGILLNVWEELEPVRLGALRDVELLGRVVHAPVYPIGPLTRGPMEVPDSRRELFRWLDDQPSESVVYVSFGSGGTMSSGQMIELAWGLELSQQRFIWVVRLPTLKTGEGSYFAPGHDGLVVDVSSYLPHGFLDRTKNIGLVVTQWAPQVEISSHPSTGVFLSHCGWNSTLESITNGVPMIAWPIYAEQKMNATLLAEEFGVAIRVFFENRRLKGKFF